MIWWYLVHMTTRIYGFDGENRWLSNFWVEKDGSSGEHRFQAAKASTAEEAAWVMAAPSPGGAKGRGRKVTLRKDWDDVRVQAMLDQLRIKFLDLELSDKLVATGDTVLIEANTWGDTFWGVDAETGQGENWLGYMLMYVRAELKRVREI